MFYQQKYNLPIHREIKKQKKVERYSPKVKAVWYIISDTVVAIEEAIAKYFYNAIDIASL